MERAMYMAHMAEYREAKATQKSINIQLYSELCSKLHEYSCKKLPDDPRKKKVERKQDPKDPMIEVSKIMLLSSSENVYQDTHQARMSLVTVTTPFEMTFIKKINSKWEQDLGNAVLKRIEQINKEVLLLNLGLWICY